MQSKVTDLRREMKGRLKTRLFFLHPGVLHSGVLTIIPDYHSRAFVKGKGGGRSAPLCMYWGIWWRTMEWPERKLFSRAHMEGLWISFWTKKKKVTNGVVTVTTLCFFRWYWWRRWRGDVCALSVTGITHNVKAENWVKTERREVLTHGSIQRDHLWHFSVK